MTVVESHILESAFFFVYIFIAKYFCGLRPLPVSHGTPTRYLHVVNGSRNTLATQAWLPRQNDIKISMER